MGDEEAGSFTKPTNERTRAFLKRIIAAGRL
jgi:hypothetical protein